MSRLALWILLAVALAGRASAQATPPAAPSSPDAPAASVPADVPAAPADAPGAPGLEPYRLAANDVITIDVLNFDLANLSSKITIPPDGMITVPLLEPVSVLGKSTREVAQILAQGWRKYIVNPTVSVSLVSKRPENVHIYGLVQKPGSIAYVPGMRMIQLIAEVGGTMEKADLSKVTVTAKDGRKQVVDLSHPETRNTEADRPLHEGDVIYIPERRVQVSVLGEVTRPGNFDYREGMTVLDALSLAGGALREASDLGQATVRRDGRDEKVDLDALLNRADMTANMRLLPGDTLHVPTARNRTYVFGAVAKPGYYTFKQGDRILDALTGTGGPLPTADLTKVSVIHVDAAGAATMDPVDLEKFLKNGDAKQNLGLGPGDVLYVPDKKQKRPFTLQDGLGVLSGLSLFGFLR